MALCLGAALHPLWYTRGLYSDGRAWLAEVLALPGTAEPSATRACALAVAGNLSSLQGTLSEAEALLHEALTTAEQTGGAFEQARCWHFLGNVARRRGALNEAAVLYERAIALARSAGNRWYTGVGHVPRCRGAV
jgi:non-specific serine/threonine protein kinase